jgi:long-chain acyl-CoA synthetase
MSNSKLDINKTKYRYFIDNANKNLNETAITYVIPIEKGKTPEDSVDLNRVYKDIKISKKQLIENIDKVADSLWALGIRKGDIITICSSNTPETIFMDYAINKIGAVPNYIYPNLTSDEIHYFLKEVNSKYIFILSEPNIKKAVLKACENTNITTIIEASAIESFPKAFKLIANLKIKQEKSYDNRIINWKELVSLGNKNKGIAKECDYEENVMSCLMHTSGTTSTPKAVMQLNKNVNAIVRNYDLSGQKFQEGKRYLQVLPIFVSFGNSTFQVMFCNNVEIVMIAEMNPKNFPGLVENYEPNYLTVTPSHWSALLISEKMENKDFGFFELIGTGGDGFANIEDRINNFLKEHNCNLPITDGYGSTEVSAIALSNLVSAYKKGTLGKPMGNVEVAIFDTETGAKLGVNEVGEIAISGDTVTLGYYNDPKTTTEIYQKHDDGQIWVHMGDLGRIDEDGFAHYEGRIKNIIARKSFKFSPLPEEKIIEKHSNVDKCCIVSMPDKQEGQVPSAHITLIDNSRKEETLREIIELCRDIQELHRPVSYRIRNEIPKTKNNKFNLNALKIEDISSMYPGVLLTEITVLNNENYDYKLKISIYPENSSVLVDKIEKDIMDFVKKMMMQEKISMCNILYDINIANEKHLDTSLYRIKSHLTAL